MIALLTLAALMAQAGQSPSPPPMTENRAPVPAQPAPANYPTSANVDRTFAIVATQGNNAELDMAQLALKRGTANEVKGFAQKMIAEHEGLMKEMPPSLRKFANAAAVERLAPVDALALRHLESVDPVDFDQAYAMQQIGDHLAALTAFYAEADNGTDPQLKALARKWLPSIQAHLELAVDLTQHIGGSTPFKGQ
ncbi:MAG: DUF4142 domain-containing protein [Acidobacteriaceae bacterium]|nr:DUF4142 domain-containing protein [Acidobacteriaceae bacterium]MBV9780902.1 DUF4142 domain-containing protein [Acidobacteriaceae bacterium]